MAERTNPPKVPLSARPHAQHTQKTRQPVLGRSGPSRLAAGTSQRTKTSENPTAAVVVVVNRSEQMLPVRCEKTRKAGLDMSVSNMWTKNTIVKPKANQG